MSPASAPVNAFDLVIFGGTGDLARRKLLPALLHRYADGQIVAGSRIIAIARDPLPVAEYRNRLRSELHDVLGAGEQQRLDAFLELIDYRALDATQDAGWADLAALLKQREGNEHVFYLATAPDLFATICERLRAVGLTANEARVVIEK